MTEPQPVDPAEGEPLDPALARDLARPAAHPLDPDAPEGVDVVQTHLSWVFLTRRRVYKLRKAARLGFVDFGSRAERNADCLREVALNRRLAPDVYLGVAPVRSGRSDASTRFWIDRPAEELSADGGTEHCVVMRRLPEGRDALSLLEAGELGASHLDAVAATLARFHAGQSLGAPAPFSRDEWLARLRGPVEENFRHLAADAIPAARVAAIAAAAREGFETRATSFDARRRAGQVVDGHGDLHLQHVWFEDGPADPVMIDCLEFDAGLRRIDTASEVAFLAMDLAYRERPWLGEHFLARYAAEADDFGLYGVVDWFASYRAAVRAKVAALAAGDSTIAAAQRAAASRSAVRHLDLCERFLAAAGAGALVLTCGTIGTGKSSVAAALAEAVGGAVISSDRTRKHLAGLAPEARSGAAPGEALYAAERTEAVYAGLLERAAPVVASGRVAVLDATFARRVHRQAAADWACARGIEVHLLEVGCDESLVRDRLARRQAAGRDPSDAGPELLSWSLSRYEPPSEWPAATHHRVRTDREQWRRALDGLAASLPAPWHRTCKAHGGGAAGGAP